MNAIMLGLKNLRGTRAVALVLSLLCGSVFATPVTPDMAMAVANGWKGENGTAFAPLGKALSVRAETGTDGTLLWYEVAMDGGGCVITSPDTRIEPVIAVLEKYEGAIPEDHALRALLTADLLNRLAVLASNDVAQASSPARLLTSATGATNAATTASAELTASITASAKKWSRLSVTSASATGATRARLGTSAGLGSGHPAVVVSYIPTWSRKFATHWGQSTQGGKSCYNYYTPSNYVCGCVATATSALLQHFRVTTAPNVTKTCRVNGTSVSLSTKGVNYDWSLLDGWTGTTTPTDAQCELLGRVAYDAGVCLGMSYKSGGSSASTSYIPYVLRNYYGFADARFAASPTADQYEKLIYAQLRCGAPVAFSVSRTDTSGTRYGHCILGVGYGETSDGTAYTRIFMGWSGSGDAWYALPDVNRYTAVDGVVTMIGTTTTTMPVYGHVTTSAGNGAAQETVSAAGQTLVTGTQGHYGVRVAPSVATKSVTYGGTKTEFTVGQWATAPNKNYYYYYNTNSTYYLYSSYRVPRLIESLPGAVNFATASEATRLPIYTSSTEACSAAQGAGKLLFVLSGGEWSSEASAVKAAIKALGTTFTSDFVFYFCNIDTDTDGMANGACAYGVFEPSAFTAAAGWKASNGLLASGSDAAASAVQTVLDAGKRAASLAIATETLPDACAGKVYTARLAATGGTSPYAWTLVPSYTETSAASTFANVGTALGFKYNEGWYGITLPFAFPYYGKTYTLLRIGTNGLLTFAGSGFAYSYNPSYTPLATNQMIAVMRSDLTTVSGDIYTLTTSEAVTIRWKAAYYGNTSSSANCSATLKKDGSIRFSYGEGNANGGEIGLSAGDGVNFLVSAKSASGAMSNADDIVFTPLNVPDGLSLASDGTLTGTCAATGSHAFVVRVTDAAGVTTTRSFALDVKASLVPTPDTAFWNDHPEILAEAGGDAAKAALMTSPGSCGTGKSKPNGEPMKVWEDYLAGTDPNDDEDVFQVTEIKVEGTTVELAWEPDLNENGTKKVRTYRKQGVKALGDTWEDVPEGHDADYNFFRVTVEMP